MLAICEQKKEVTKYILTLVELDEAASDKVMETLKFDDMTDFVCHKAGEFSTDDWKTNSVGISAGQQKSLENLTLNTSVPQNFASFQSFLFAIMPHLVNSMTALKIRRPTNAKWINGNIMVT